MKILMLTVIQIHFNSQPREGGWGGIDGTDNQGAVISTHSRAKAAGDLPDEAADLPDISTHSRAKAAGNG